MIKMPDEEFSEFLNDSEKLYEEIIHFLRDKHEKRVIPADVCVHANIRVLARVIASFFVSPPITPEFKRLEQQAFFIKDLYQQIENFTNEILEKIGEKND